MSRIYSDSSSRYNQNKLTRLSSTDLSTSSDPLRLVKVNSNPLGRQAEKTLELLEQQNEWKKERWKELSDGGCGGGGGGQNDSSSNEDWQASLTRWKSRRRSEPFYSGSQTGQRPSLQLVPRPADDETVTGDISDVDQTDNSTVVGQKYNATTTTTTVTSQTIQTTYQTDTSHFPVEQTQSSIEHHNCQRDVTVSQPKSVDDVTSCRLHGRIPAPSNDDVRSAERYVNDTAVGCNPETSKSLDCVNRVNERRTDVEFNATSQHGLNKMATDSFCTPVCDRSPRRNCSVGQEQFEDVKVSSNVTSRLLSGKPVTTVTSPRGTLSVHVATDRIVLTKPAGDEDSVDRKIGHVTPAGNPSVDESHTGGSRPLVPSFTSLTSSSPSSAAAAQRDDDDDMPPPLPSVRPPSLHWTMYTSRDRYYDNDELELVGGVEVVSVTSPSYPGHVGQTNSDEKVPDIVSSKSSVNSSTDKTVITARPSTSLRPSSAASSVSKSNQVNPVSFKGSTSGLYGELGSSTHEIVTGQNPSLKVNVPPQADSTVCTEHFTDNNGRNGLAANGSRDQVSRDQSDVETNNYHVASTSSHQTALLSWQKPLPADSSDVIHGNENTPSALQTMVSALDTCGSDVIDKKNAGGGHVVMSSARRNSGALFRLNASPKPKFIESGSWIGRQDKTFNNNNNNNNNNTQL